VSSVVNGDQEEAQSFGEVPRMAGRKTAWTADDLSPSLGTPQRHMAGRHAAVGFNAEAYCKASVAIPNKMMIGSGTKDCQITTASWKAAR
jgi:hypothetical protein